MATPRPRFRAVPLRPLLHFLLVPLIYSVSRLHPWSPEKGVCLPPPTAPKRPDHLVLGPAADRVATTASSATVFLEQKFVEFDRVEGFNHFVLTDSDIAVVDDLGYIFKKYPHCHLALTFRNNKEQWNSSNKSLNLTA